MYHHPQILSPAHGLAPPGCLLREGGKQEVVLWVPASCAAWEGGYLSSPDFFLNPTHAFHIAQGPSNSAAFLCHSPDRPALILGSRQSSVEMPRDPKVPTWRGCFWSQWVNVSAVFEIWNLNFSHNVGLRGE